MGGSGRVGHVVGHVWLKKGNLGQKWVLVTGLVTWTTNRVFVVLFVQSGNFSARPTKIQTIWVRWYDGSMRSLAQVIKFNHTSTRKHTNTFAMNHLQRTRHICNIIEHGAKQVHARPLAVQTHTHDVSRQVETLCSNMNVKFARHLKMDQTHTYHACTGW